MKNYRQNKEQVGIFGKQTFLKKKIPKAVRKKFRQKRGGNQRAAFSDVLKGRKVTAIP